jgi:excisionase family DNA binding protein
MTNEDDVLTVEEAAAALKVNPATVQRELKAQRLPGNKVGRAWRIRRADLERHLRGQERDPYLAMQHAASCFHVGDLKNGLVALVGGLGYEELPAELRFALTKRVTRLIDATEAEDLDRAEEIMASTRWAPDGDDAFAISYIPTVGRFSPPWTVRLPGVWNDMLDEFEDALRTHYRHRSETSSE